MPGHCTVPNAVLGTPDAGNSKKFIVMFKDDATKEEIAAMKENVGNEGGKITDEYNIGKLRGFAAIMPTSLHTSMLNHAKISSIEEDQEVRIQDQ
ncbi:hypothetical protein THASP1DRAFT_28232 [Thamnocephalis sphaerospora]|uniref:Inhibitor I9 domain-containing protein n=1 Tax=Thamnocephalis sphaerospora TaxID=78915 RepID=A0A4P9XUV7_9FUNG|nr:hypothetical protein THASP1DRAFT_28232 [Thamnocephalis sphaerospora]|eukprot:RKP10006.1 hypothetical protein THASP1DRAFT_28232 [Thamnocephalis sphaerospora]